MEAIERLVQSLDDRDPEVRQAAVKALGKGATFGDDIAVELLVRRTADADEDVREAALQALQRVAPRGHEAAAAAALRCLSDGDAYARRAAATALGALCCAPAAAGPSLVRALRDEDREVRAAVVEALGQLGIEALLLPELLPLLGEGAATRRSAARALPLLAPRGHGDALAAALRLLAADCEDAVRWAAAIAVGELALPGDTVALEALVAASRDEDEDVRAEALRGIAATALPGEAALPAVIAALQDDCEEVRLAAVAAMSTVRVGDVQAVASVCSLLDREEEEVRCAALRALATLARRGQVEAVDAVAACLADSDEDVREAAVDAAAALAAPSDAAVLALLSQRLVDDPEEEVRSACAKAIGSLKGCTAALILALDDDASQVRLAATLALAAVGLDSEASITALVGRLVDSEEDVRSAALEALLAGAQGVLEDALRQLLSRAEAGVRCTAAGGVAQLRVPWATEALAGLACRDQDAQVREAARAGLARLEPAAALAALEPRACSDADSSVRAAALEALASLESSAATQVLLRGLQDKEPGPRGAAARLAMRLCSGPMAATVRRGCMRCLTTTARARRGAVAVLREAWPRGDAAAAAELRLLLAHEDVAVRVAALRCLPAASGGEAHDELAAVQPTVALLDSEEEVLREAAAVALGELAARWETLAELRPMLASARSSTREAAAQAVAAVCAPEVAAEATALLLPLAADVEAAVRWAALRALAAARGEGARVAALRCAEDGDEQVRVAAIQTLASLGERDDAVLSVLQRHLEDSSHDVALASARALQAMDAALQALEEADIAA